jgi:hypothetical protein
MSVCVRKIVGESQLSVTWSLAGNATIVAQEAIYMSVSVNQLRTHLRFPPLLLHAHVHVPQARHACGARGWT